MLIEIMRSADTSGNSSPTDSFVKSTSWSWLARNRTQSPVPCDSVGTRIAEALAAHQQTLQAGALKASMDNEARRQMVRGIHPLLQQFAQAFERKLSIRLKLAPDGKSITVVMMRSRLDFFRRPDRFRISADVDTFIQGDWKFKVVKCKSLWWGGMVYSRELEAGTTADGVIDFLIVKAVALLQ